MQTVPTCHVLTLSCSSGFASLGLGCQSFLGLMRHDSTSIVVACKAASHPRPCVSKCLSAHVLDAFCEVALMPLLAVPAPSNLEHLRRSHRPVKAWHGSRHRSVCTSAADAYVCNLQHCRKPEGRQAGMGLRSVLHWLLIQKSDSISCLKR